LYETSEIGGERRRGRRMTARKILAPLLVALVVLGALLWFVAGLPLRDARKSWEAGRDAAAIDTAQKWSGLHVRRAEYEQILAAAWLTAGNDAAAKPHLEALAHSSLWLSAIPKDVVARRLFAAGRYAEFLSYDAASHDRSEGAEVPLYRAAALAATDKIEDAERVFRTVNRSAVNARKAAALEQAIAAERKGFVPYVFDRSGRLIASRAVQERELVVNAPEFSSIVDSRAGTLTIGAQAARLGARSTLDTTLDTNVQRAAIAALASYRGSLVAIDPRTNELLAVASTSGGNGPPANLAFEKQYEPGSVIKVLTGLNAYTNGVDLKSMFPYECKGDLMIDGRHFGDWIGTGHGLLPSLDEALAQSCNIVFADVGLRLGGERLHKFMQAAGFDGQANLGPYAVPLGKTVGDIFNKYETAFYAIGLEHESLNAVHLAMLASMMANRGVLSSPRLLIQRRSILGDIVPAAPALPGVRLAPPEAANAMIRAMQTVVTSEKGTGRRAAIPGLSIAMKTGTAGKRSERFQGLIVCFAPVESPKIAFGLIIEGAGPAEFAAAKVARDFLLAMQGQGRL
jgi:peptidoglycan glycosyltransferase